MSRLNTIKKALQTVGVKNYKIIEETTRSYEQFYVIGKLETIRQTEITTDTVTVYKDTSDKNGKFVGSSSFVIEHLPSKKELVKKIEDTLYAASFIKNEYFELEKGYKKKAVLTKKTTEEPMTILNKMAKIFIDESNDEARFNALELFFVENEKHIINTNNVDYRNRTININIEAIPSFNSKDFKTELYRMFRYDNVNYDKVKEDAKAAIYDVYNRGKAQPIKLNKKINVILHDKDLCQVYWELLSSFDLGSVYNHSNLKSVGDSIQENPVCPLTISLIPQNKADFFDNEGVMLKKHMVVEKSVIQKYWGSSRFAYYFKKEPTGILNKIEVKKGNKPIEKLRKKPYIEILDLSGIQTDIYSNYVGGEVRLAMYFDGKQTIPVSGFSFSANLQEAINNIRLSKEESDLPEYKGSKYALIPKVDIN